MENWREVFLNRLAEVLEPHYIDGVYLEGDEINPDTLRLMFQVPGETGATVVTDFSIYVMDDGKQLLQVYTQIALEAFGSPELYDLINKNNFPATLGNFGYFEEERQLYHKYQQIVEEPTDMDDFMRQMIISIDLILGTVYASYNDLYPVARKLV